MISTVCYIHCKLLLKLIHTWKLAPSENIVRRHNNMCMGLEGTCTSQLMMCLVIMRQHSWCHVRDYLFLLRCEWSQEWCNYEPACRPSCSVIVPLGMDPRYYQELSSYIYHFFDAAIGSGTMYVAYDFIYATFNYLFTGRHTRILIGGCIIFWDILHCIATAI